jgi:hypothetical protein
MDVIWLLDNTPESNPQSAEWTELDEPNPKRGKPQRLAAISILGCAWYYIHRLPRKGPDRQQRVLQGVIGAFKRWNQEKRPHLKKKSAVSSRQCTVSQINQNDGEIAWNRLRNASSSTVFSRSGPQWLFSVCRPQQNACWKEIIEVIEKRGNRRNWDLFWGWCNRSILTEACRAVLFHLYCSFSDWTQLFGSALVSRNGRSQDGKHCICKIWTIQMISVSFTTDWTISNPN